MEGLNGHGAGGGGDRPVTSIEKLHAMTLAASAKTPESEDQARALSLFQMVAPFVAGMMPDDPAELDALLLNGARWALALRSDGAPEPETIEELTSEAGL
jgi:hypothetical protein